MKLEINRKGFAVLHATTKEESDRMMLFYLGKSPATHEKEEKRGYTHSRSYAIKRGLKKKYEKMPRQSCQYGCGEFKSLPAHMLQKHGQGKNGVPRTPNLKLRKGTHTSERREYLTLPELPDFSSRK